MKFYLDFEATQFSGRIISIGCVSENNETFYTLCKPSKRGEKITKFITKLTGITNEMIADAPTADEAFNDFFDWVINTSDDSVPEYYVYGDADTHFISNTIRHMTDVHAISFASSIKALMIDYAPYITQHFGCNVGLNRIFNFLQTETIEQRHNALEDAKMLMYVENNFNINTTSNVGDLPPSTHRKRNKNRTLPDVWYEWEDGKGKLWTVNTCADENNWGVKYFDGTNMKYFNNIETAALWVIRYKGAHCSAKNERDLRAIEKNIQKSIKNNKRYFGAIWEEKENEE